MRVISGSARSIRLKTLEGMNTRPTQDRIKETLFNMLQTDIPGCRFLDLFSGSGGIGIEAASRGASKAVLIESNAKACQIIKENITATRLTDRCQVIQGELPRALDQLFKEDVFDFIFMDPPYNQLWEKKILEHIKDSSLIDSYTSIIVEASLDTDFSYLDELGYEIYKDKRYKTNKHVFIRVK